MKGKLYSGLTILFLIILTFSFSAISLADNENSVVSDLNLEIPLELGVYELERDDGGYFTIVDNEGNVLDKTIRHIYVNDEFIAEDNRRYRVKKVSGDTAYAELVGKEQITWEEPLENPVDTVPVQGGNTKNLIGMYYTHSAESYVPSDGTESKPGNGGIFEVGDALGAKLEKIGVNVINDKTPHEPRDANAYRRSRRTAVDLLKKAPAALIDVHRDGVPDPDFYQGEIDGQPVTRVRLVVGRQNQNMQANLDFAKRIKAYLDEKHPGLIRGIFMAKGNYNQDLAPRVVLAEMGTHTNKKELAENGAEIFAEALPPVLGISTAASQAGPNVSNEGTTGGDWTALLWIVGVLVVGGAIFLWISTGSWEGAKNKLKEFSSKEWASYLGSRENKKENKRIQQETGTLNNYLRDQEKVEKKLKDTNDEKAESQKD